MKLQKWSSEDPFTSIYWIFTGIMPILVGWNDRINWCWQLVDPCWPHPDNSSARPALFRDREGPVPQILLWSLQRSAFEVIISIIFLKATSQIFQRDFEQLAGSLHRWFSCPKQHQKTMRHEASRCLWWKHRPCRSAFCILRVAECSWNHSSWAT